MAECTCNQGRNGSCSCRRNLWDDECESDAGPDWAFWISFAAFLAITVISFGGAVPYF